MQGAPIESSVTEPASFDISSPIEYELVLETPASLGLRPLECWLSTGDVTQYPRGYFVENGYAMHDTHVNVQGCTQDRMATGCVPVVKSKRMNATK